jgi:phosphohistidine phosphatase
MAVAAPLWQAPAVDAESVRKLVLLRHAKSAWPDDVPDHDRPLGRRGRRDAPAAGRWLRLAGCIPDHALCSTARRARDTWQLAQAELGARPATDFESGVYEACASGLLDLIRRLPPAAQTVIIVGHDPALPELALALAGNGWSSLPQDGYPDCGQVLRSHASGVSLPPQSRSSNSAM